MKCKVPIRRALHLLDQAMEKGMKMQTEYLEAMRNILGHPRIDEVEEEIYKWHDNNQGLIEEIFEGVEPQIRYMPIDRVDISKGVPLMNPLQLSSGIPRVDCRQFLVKQLKVLAELYREIEKLCGTPLTYIDSKKQIRYMDKVCPLGTNNSGVYLVQYMFQNHDFNEQVPVDTLLKELETKATTLRNAVDSVNKRARKSLGFNILSRPRGVVILIDETPIKL